MSEEIGAGFGPQSAHELAGAATEFVFSALGAFPQEALEDAVGSLDRIEVRRIRRQVTQRRADGFDGFLHTLNLMSRNIVHDDNVATLEGRRQALLDISKKDLAIERPLDHHRCGHAIAAQRCHEGQRLPGRERHVPDHPLASRTAAKVTRHVGVHRCLINKDKVGRIKQPLLTDPASAGASNVRALLLAGVQHFYRMARPSAAPETYCLRATDSEGIDNASRGSRD